MNRWPTEPVAPRTPVVVSWMALRCCVVRWDKMSVLGEEGGNITGPNRGVPHFFVGDCVAMFDGSPLDNN